MHFVTRMTKCIGWRSEYTPTGARRVSHVVMTRLTSLSVWYVSCHLLWMKTSYIVIPFLVWLSLQWLEISILYFIFCDINYLKLKTGVRASVCFVLFVVIIYYYVLLSFCTNHFISFAAVSYVAFIWLACIIPHGYIMNSHVVTVCILFVLMSGTFILRFYVANL